MTNEEFHDAMRSMTDPYHISTTTIGRSVRPPPKPERCVYPLETPWEKTILPVYDQPRPQPCTTKAIKRNLVRRKETALEKRINRIIGIVGRTIRYLVLGYLATGLGYTIYLIVNGAQ